MLAAEEAEPCDRQLDRSTYEGSYFNFPQPVGDLTVVDQPDSRSADVTVQYWISPLASPTRSAASRWVPDIGGSAISMRSTSVTARPARAIAPLTALTSSPGRLRQRAIPAFGPSEPDQLRRQVTTCRLIGAAANGKKYRRAATRGGIVAGSGRRGGRVTDGTLGPGKSGLVHR